MGQSRIQVRDSIVSENKDLLTDNLKISSQNINHFVQFIYQKKKKNLKMENIFLYQDDSSQKSPTTIKQDDQNIYLYETKTNCFDLFDSNKKSKSQKPQFTSYNSKKQKNEMNNNKSQRIQKHIDFLKQNLRDNNQSKQYQKSKNPEGPVYLYEMALKKILYRKQLVQERNEKILEAQLEHCTFQPKLDIQSMEMQQENHISIVKKTQDHLEKAKKSNKDSYTIKLEKELTQCTFHPAINHLSESKNQTQDTYDRMKEWKQKLLLKIEKMKEQKNKQDIIQIKYLGFVAEQASTPETSKQKQKQGIDYQVMFNNNISAKYLSANQVLSEKVDKNDQYISGSPEKDISQTIVKRNSLDNDIIQTVQLLKGLQTQISGQKQLNEQRSLKESIRKSMPNTNSSSKKNKCGVCNQLKYCQESDENGKSSLQKSRTQKLKDQLIDQFIRRSNKHGIKNLTSQSFYFDQL